jgi:hypothetical protein
MMRSLLWTTSLRGEHSTGVYSYHPYRPKKEKHKLRKELGPSPLFILRDDGRKVQESSLGTVMSDVIFGHCRYATKGKITVENAHPFDTGRYVGMHNGTLTDKKYRHETKTDSEMMFLDMEERGIVPVLNDLDYMSAYSIAMFDKRTEEVIFATNGDRPLNFAVNNKRRTMYFASELSALKFAAGRHREDVTFYSFEKNKVYSANVNDVTHQNDHAFWDIEDLEPKDKKFDWSIMDWEQGPSTSIQGPTVRSCCACGTVLEGDSLKNADAYVFHESVYLTCPTCIGDVDQAEEEYSAAVNQ